MIAKLLTEHHLEFLSLTEGCRGPPESTLVKMSNCWKSHATAHFIETRSLFIDLSIYKQIFWNDYNTGFNNVIFIETVTV